MSYYRMWVYDHVNILLHSYNLQGMIDKVYIYDQDI